MLLALTVAGCATNEPASQKRVTYWTLANRPYVPSKNLIIRLKRPSGEILVIPSGPSKSLLEAKNKIQTATGFEFDLVIIDSQDVNAHAFVKDGSAKVGFTLGYITAFGQNRDITGVTMGHEVSHHLLGHVDGRRAEREKTTQQTAQALGILANFLVPFSGTFVSMAVTGVGRSYTRDEEREADENGMKLAQASGYDICQAIQFWKSMNASAKDSALKGVISTHPSDDERIESVEKISQKLKGKSC